MAASCTDALQMVAAARYYPQLLSIMANALRFLPAFVLMRRLIEEGYCGALQVYLHLLAHTQNTHIITHMRLTHTDTHTHTDTQSYIFSITGFGSLLLLVMFFSKQSSRRANRDD